MLGRLVVALILAASVAQAGPVRQWSIEELAQVDVLAVARVDSVSTGPLQEHQLYAQMPVHTCTAGLSVLRSFGQAPAHISLPYDCYGELPGGMSQGYPEFPTLKEREVLVFPLMHKGSKWTLIGPDGRGLLVPAVSAEPDGPKAVAPRAFLIAELANNLLQGTYPQMYRAGQYFAWQPSEKVPKELLAVLKSRIPYGDPRWLDIGTAALATMGIPRLPLETLIASPPPLTFAPLALAQVPESRRRPGIVRNMLRYSNVHGWGSAATLVPEFKDDLLLLKLLPDYLQKLQPGAVSIAWWLARNEQKSLMSASLAAALRTLAMPVVADGNDVNAATSLVVTYGNDAEFAQFLVALGSAKEHDPKRYMQLWWAAPTEAGPRTLKIVAAVISDERPMDPSTTMRYCDIAGGRLQMISHQEFGFKNWGQAIAERNVAVARARNWLKMKE